MIKNAKIVGKKVDSEAYHAPDGKERGSKEFVVSSSSLRAFYFCPSKWVTPIIAMDGSKSWFEHKATDSTRWGNLLDSFVLTPELFDRKYVVLPADAPRRPTKAQLNAKKNSPESAAAIAWWASFQSEHEDMETLDAEELFNVKQAAQRLMSFPGVGDYIRNCDTQVEIRAEWHDEETGLVIPLKCLIDLVPNEDSELAVVDPVFLKSLGDLKTTCNAKPSAWDRWCETAGYSVQAAFNTDMLVAATGRDICSFNFLLSESHAPWQPDKVMMTNDPIEKSGDVDSGREQYRRMLTDYCRCLKTGFWPGYSDTDEAVEGHWRVKRPDPYAAQRRQFSPQYEFSDVAEEPTPEVEDFLH